MELRYVGKVAASKLIGAILRVPSRKIGLYNGVGVRNVPLVATADILPRYEEQLLQGTRDSVNPGDSVIVIGAGIGVSSVIAARRAGESGKVLSYEPSIKRYNLAIGTIKYNNVNNTVTIYNQKVSDSGSVFGEGSGDVVSPAELPECDVLICDAEGAEINILQLHDCNPREIVVETHGYLGSPTERTIEVLEARDFDIQSRWELPQKYDLSVIHAIRS